MFIVDVTTSKGVFAIEVNPSWAPNGAARFRELVDAAFYNDARFFRVLSGFVAQFGINGTPATNSMWSSRTIPDDPVVRSNTRGYVTFAQGSALNSRTTQLFVNLGNNARLDTTRRRSDVASRTNLGLGVGLCRVPLRLRNHAAELCLLVYEQDRT